MPSAVDTSVGRGTASSCSAVRDQVAERLAAGLQDPPVRTISSGSRTARTGASPTREPLGQVVEQRGADRSGLGGAAQRGGGVGAREAVARASFSTAGRAGDVLEAAVVHRLAERVRVLRLPATGM